MLPTEIPVLPSSLGPLPGECLPGYLLRLAYRLELPPARTAELCGLAGVRIRHGQIPVDHLIELPDGISARFARTASLASGEAAGLTLSRYRHAYPALTARGGGGSIASAYTDTWAASFSSRYCPECLAEDARQADGSFGGAWKLSWHLPVVFACTAHGRLLEHACPACGSAVNGSSGRASLIARPHAAALHPHQCRNPAGSSGEGRAGRRVPSCGGRLDSLISPPPACLPRDDLERMLGLQAKISQMLGQDPAEGTNARAAYFPDLLATTRLLILSWPAGSALAGSQALASLIDEHAEPARKAAIPARDSTGQARRGRPDANVWGPPGPAAQCGALILAADSMISDPAGLRDQVQELARTAAQTSQRAFRAIRNMEDLSPAYRRALAPRGRAPSCPGQPPAVPAHARLLVHHRGDTPAPSREMVRRSPLGIRHPHTAPQQLDPSPPAQGRPSQARRDDRRRNMEAMRRAAGHPRRPRNQVGPHAPQPDRGLRPLGGIR